MYTSIRLLLGGLFLALFATLPLAAQNLAQAEAELKLAHTTETEAYMRGECSVILALLDEDVSFYANGGESMLRDDIKNLCSQARRPFSTPIADNTTIKALSPTTGYTVRVIEHDGTPRGHAKTVTTKVWEKGKDGWKVVHFQSMTVPAEES